MLEKCSTGLLHQRGKKFVQKMGLVAIWCRALRLRCRLFVMASSHLHCHRCTVAQGAEERESTNFDFELAKILLQVGGSPTGARDVERRKRARMMFETDSHNEEAHWLSTRTRRRESNLHPPHEDCLSSMLCFYRFEHSTIFQSLPPTIFSTQHVE